MENTLVDKYGTEVLREYVKDWSDRVRECKSLFELKMILDTMYLRDITIIGSRGIRYCPIQMSSNITYLSGIHNALSMTNCITRALGLRDKVEELLGDIKS